MRIADILIIINADSLSFLPIDVYPKTYYETIYILEGGREERKPVSL